MKTKSALSYFGSDSEVASQLASMLDQCKHVTIPFVGGAAIIPHIKARAIVANDLNDEAINFYRVASGVYGDAAKGRLIHDCQHTLSHPSELDRAANIEPLDTIGRAWAYWARCWVARKGKGGTSGEVGMPSVRWTATGGTNASRIRAAAGDLEAWAEHFQRCEWQSLDFRGLLTKVKDRPDCGIYCDPPWVGAGDAYLHSFTDQDHAELAADLQTFRHALVVVRYGDHPMIRMLYSGWNIIDASSRDQCNKVKGEIWITNTPKDTP